MASDTNLNIILGQGHAIKSIYNVKKQNLELQQQFASQHTEVKEKKDKEVVQEFSAENKVQITKDGEKKNKEHSKGPKKELNTTDKMEEEPEAEGLLIDIKV